MSNRVTILVASLLAIIAYSAGFVALTTGNDPVACTADARLDAPEGWSWARDGDNDCAWTLYDAQGNEAPETVYEAAGVDAPPSSFDLTAPLAFAVGTGAALIAAITALRPQRASANDA